VIFGFPAFVFLVGREGAGGTLTLVTELAQEKFDVWTWKAVHGRETQRRVLCDDRASDLQGTGFDRARQRPVKRKKNK
jgi:hypothetical protein